MTDMTDLPPLPERDPWTKMELPEGVADCPCCGSRPDLYKYLKDPEGPRRLEISCSNAGLEADGLFNLAQCPLTVPPGYFLCETIKGAVRTWNDYAAALVKCRQEKRDAQVAALTVTDAMLEAGLRAARDASDARLPRYSVVRAILEAALGGAK